MKKMSGVKCSLVIIVVSLLSLLIAYFFTNETTAELLSCLKAIVFKYEFESIVLLTIVLILAVILFLTGYVFGSKFWGKGYATETLKIVIEYLIKECNFHLVEAKHHASNPASGRVMEKAGMKKDGILRERRKNKLIDGYDDLVIYSITKSDLT